MTDNAATIPRKGVMSGSVWTPYAKRVDADGTLVILAKSETGYPTEFSWTEWQVMELVTERTDGK